MSSRRCIHGSIVPPNVSVNVDCKDCYIIYLENKIRAISDEQRNLLVELTLLRAQNDLKFNTVIKRAVSENWEIARFHAIKLYYKVRKYFF